ncbi:hypothetical protein BMS3Abin09_00476 [bacterium BMS3Abin09]|nr:hypothetical protein BMS3Abin09_00476 [bacterium BMS3Abin09]
MKPLFAVREAFETEPSGVRAFVVISPLPMSSSRAFLMILSMITQLLFEILSAIILVSVGFPPLFDLFDAYISNA